MEEYTIMIQRDTFEGAFFRAVLQIHKNQFVRAQSVSRLYVLLIGNRYLLLGMYSLSGELISFVIVFRTGSRNGMNYQV